MAATRVHIYKRSATYWIRYTSNGEHQRQSLGTKDLSIARRIANKIEKDLILDIHQIPSSKIPIEDFLQRYFADAEIHKRPRTVQTDHRAIDTLRKYESVQYVSDITPEKIESFKRKMLNNGLCPTTVNIMLRHLSAVLGKAVKWELIPTNPVGRVNKLKISKNPPLYLSKEQSEIILGIAKRHGQNIYWIFALGLYAGMRKNEIVNARWEWFDFKRMTITISNYDEFVLKTSSSRTLPLHSKLAEVLKPFFKESGFLFEPNKNSHLSEYRYEFKKAFDSVRNEAKLEWVTPHILRHTFASQLAIAGISLYKISKWLGHSNFTTTQIYAHLQAGDEEIEKI